MKTRLDHYLALKGLVASRSQAESYIKLGQVSVNGNVITKSGFMVGETADVKFMAADQYVSRAGLKLASVSAALHLDFKDKTVLDVGSSTGGFTDYAIRHGARKVYAVDVGTDQLHPTLHGHDKIELHEQTDIRDFTPPEAVDVILIDVSFISIREILPHLATLAGPKTLIAAMLKPQFESGAAAKNKGIIKNDRIRRDILKDFENWARKSFTIVDKADSDIAGAKGNRERFYLLKKALPKQ